MLLTLINVFCFKHLCVCVFHRSTRTPESEFSFWIMNNAVDKQGVKRVKHAWMGSSLRNQGTNLSVWRTPLQRANHVLGDLFDMPSGVCNLIMVYASKQIVYAVGGLGDRVTALSCMAAWYPGAWAWAPGPSLNVGRRYHGCASIDGALYVAGGCPSAMHGVLRSVEKLGIDCDRWEQIAHMSTPRVGLGLASLNGSLFAVGGFAHRGKPLTTVEMYVPAKDQWALVAQLNIARSHCSVAVINGTLFVFGGMSNTMDSRLDSVEKYDAKDDSWKLVAPMKHARMSFGVGCVGGKVYVIGGTSPGFNPVPKDEVYDPVEDSWSLIEPMAPQRYGHAVVEVEGSLYAIGGHPVDEALKHSRTNSDVERYDIESCKWEELRVDMYTSRVDFCATSM